MGSSFGTLPDRSLLRVHASQSSKKDTEWMDLEKYLFFVSFQVFETRGVLLDSRYVRRTHLSTFQRGKKGEGGANLQPNPYINS